MHKSTNRGIKIYCDSGAAFSTLIRIPYCELYQYPYDSPDRPNPKKGLLLAKPSAAQWGDCHAPWMEHHGITWGDFRGSPLLSQIKPIIGAGPENRRDVLHFDSAYKTGCKIFITSDKGDIWSKRNQLEDLTDIKTFCTPLENAIVLEYLSILQVTSQQVHVHGCSAFLRERGLQRS